MAKSERAFTLIELLIYVAIFAVVAGFFTSILLITLRVQGTQSGVVEVSSQLNFAIQRIQNYIQSAQVVTAPASGVSGNTLNLDSGATVINLGTCGGVASAICVNNTPITTAKIRVNALTFSHYTTPSNNPATPPSETVQFTVTADNNTQNPQQLISRTLQGSASPLNQ